MIWTTRDYVAAILAVLALIVALLSGSFSLIVMAVLLAAFIGWGIYSNWAIVPIAGTIVMIIVIACPLFSAIPVAVENTRSFGANFTWPKFPGSDALGENRAEWKPEYGAPPAEVMEAFFVNGEEEYNLNGLHYSRETVVAYLAGKEGAIVMWSPLVHGDPSPVALAQCYAQIDGTWTDPTTGLTYDCMALLELAAQPGNNYADPRPGHENDGLNPAAGAIDKCTWLRANFPQTTEAIQAFGAQLANVPVERIATHAYRCTETSMVFDGFIVLGPNEGDWTTSFTLAVPRGGVVDAYKESTCTGRSEYIGPETDTLRCYDGSMTAVRATYWPWYDQNPPTGVAAPIGANAAAAEASSCIDPATLAKQEGWTIISGPDQYGGVVVTVSTDYVLPAGWMAIGPNEDVEENDSQRTIYTGNPWTVYPPYECRAELGYSK